MLIIFYINKVRRRIKSMFLDKHKRELSFYKKLVGKNNLFFDIGANVGDKTEKFLNVGVRVVSVEPQTECVKILKDKFLNNKNVIIVDKCLGSELKEIKLKICSKSNVVSTVADHWQQGRCKGEVFDKEEVVQMIRLDDIIKEHGVPDYCKIDVEGYEYEVISGLSSKIPCLSFEFTSEFFGHAEKCLAKLDKLGFKYFNYALDENPDFQLFRWVDIPSLVKDIRWNINRDDKLWGDIYAR